MFGKNPYLLPVGALIFLVILFTYQRHQRKLADTLSGGPTKAGNALVIDDPGTDKQFRSTAECGDAGTIVKSYRLGSDVSKGTVEFDLLAAPAEGPEAALFSIHAGTDDPCRPGAGRVLSLSYAASGRKLLLAAGPGENPAVGSFALPEGKTMPCRLLCEWNENRAVLYLDGEKMGEQARTAGAKTDDYRLSITLDGREKGTKTRAFRLFLIPKG